MERSPRWLSRALSSELRHRRWGRWARVADGISAIQRPRTPAGVVHCLCHSTKDGVLRFHAEEWEGTLWTRSNPQATRAEEPPTRAARAPPAVPAPRLGPGPWANSRSCVSTSPSTSTW